MELCDIPFIVTGMYVYMLTHTLLLCFCDLWVQELRKGGQVSDRPSEAEMKKHAPPLDVKQELSSDEGYMGWEVR